MTTSQSIEPFRVDIPQSDLDDLSARLAATRWPGEVAKAGTAYGMPLEVVQRLARRWQDGYDWRAHEARLNEIPQFTTDIDGTNLHFLHVRSPEPGARAAAAPARLAGIGGGVPGIDRAADRPAGARS